MSTRALALAVVMAGAVAMTPGAWGQERLAAPPDPTGLPWIPGRIILTPGASMVVADCLRWGLIFYREEGPQQVMPPAPGPR